MIQYGKGGIFAGETRANATPTTTMYIYERYNSRSVGPSLVKSRYFETFNTTFIFRTSLLSSVLQRRAAKFRLQLFKIFGDFITLTFRIILYQLYHILLYHILLYQ